jgi:Protein of unknown function (DUF1566)
LNHYGAGPHGSGPTTGEMSEMTGHLRTTTGAMLVLLLAGTSLAGPTPGQKCEKNKKAAKSANCRLLACQGNLGTCDGDLTTCGSDLGTCNGNLTTCTANLTSTQASLTTCTGSRGTCSTNLTTCQNDLTTCQEAPQGQRLKTGQTICYDTAGAVIACAGTGQDGELQNGLARAYVDNGDGTITDTKTGLMWEKLSLDGSIHDVNANYTWTDAFATKVAALNGDGGFAGHTDWRVPNRSELESLLNLGVLSPAVFPVFNTGCAPPCTVFTCSCTQANDYWSSSTYQFEPQFAWAVNFTFGSVFEDGKTLNFYVRAVRGGS